MLWQTYVDKRHVRLEGFCGLDRIDRLPVPHAVQIRRVLKSSQDTSPEDLAWVGHQYGEWCLHTCYTVTGQ